jgi:CRP/FNR family cyclic AMP-dependent transcriptional regulator
MRIRKTLLRNLSLFSDLTEPELTVLSNSLREMHYPEGSIVFHEGDIGDFLLLIVEGKVKVVLFGEQGQETILRTMNPGTFFGELSLIDEAPRSASVVTLENSSFLQLKREVFLEVLRMHPNISLKVLRQLSVRVRDLTEEIRSLTMFDIYGRVLRCLVRLGQAQGKREKATIILLSPPTNQDLARMIGCARETVSRAMKVLQENEYLKTVSHGLQIQERALKQYWPSL